MAKQRVEIPLVIVDRGGVPVQGASVQVNLRGTLTTAPVYQGQTGSTQVTNPVVTDQYGRVQGWLDRGAYDAVVTATGLETFVERLDISPGDDAGIDAAWLAARSVGLAKLDATGEDVGNALFVDSGGGVVAQPIVVQGFPIGYPVLHLGPASTIASDYLALYGQSLLRADYPELFTLWGTLHGAADGSHFNAPDARGCTLYGHDTAGGLASAAGRMTRAAALGAHIGVEYVALITANLPAHDHGGGVHAHGITDPSHTHSGRLWDTGTTGGAARANRGNNGGISDLLAAFIDAAPTGITVNNSAAIIASQGSGTGHDNVSPGIVGIWVCRAH